MLIIPVIDLLNGIVVHAQEGTRHTYQPVHSKLTKQADIKTVFNIYYKLFNCKIIYIADLNSIQQNGDNLHIITSLAMEQPDCEFWIDAGITCLTDNSLNGIGNITIVFGTENKIPEDNYVNLMNDHPDLILSLDFNQRGLVENQYLLSKPDLWPERTIVMMLDRVGSDKGVDFKLLNTVLKIKADGDIYAAGGIQDINDLKQMKKMGINGALMASALHTGSITQTDLSSLL